MGPVIDEFREARTFQGPPIQQHAIAALNGRERAPFMGDIISRRLGGDKHACRGSDYGCASDEN